MIEENEKDPTAEQEQPTQEQYIAYMEDTIKLTKVRLELQKLQAELAVARAEELKALSFIAQVTQGPIEPPSEEETTEKPRKLSRNA